MPIRQLIMYCLQVFRHYFHSSSTFSAVFLEIGPWNHGSRASKVACALAVSGSVSAGEDADADDDAADDDVTVNGSEMLHFVILFIYTGTSTGSTLLILLNTKHHKNKIINQK